MPLFSVIIPTYNRERVIGKTIQSVLNQTNQDFEIIVVDDGSKDNTKSVVVNFQSDKIKYYYQQNQGAQVARNYGLSKATGDYVCFLDSDDVWLPSFLEEVYGAFASDKEVGCAYCWIGYMQNGEVYGDGGQYTLSGYIYKDALEQGYITKPSALMIKKSCFVKIGKWDESFNACQDDDICFRLAKEYKFALIDRVLTIYNTDYDGDDNRICKSTLRVATGWWTLWNKFEKDVLELCGRKIMALHLMNCASRFIKAERYEMGLEAYKKAISYYGSEKKMRDDFEYEIKQFAAGGKVYCYGAGEIGGKASAFLRGLGINIE
ncbi:glycosyltransferase family A protein, partial [Anaerovibrio sp.]|uniref:glycosyltransferase family 2 protein n=1 Tax=Anaerovibrio sp. TaxID=1872532 RepID=UPI0025C47D85